MSSVIYISALAHARQLKFSIYFRLLSSNQIFQYCHTRVILCNVGDAYIFGYGLYISALEHASMVILGNSVLLASINKRYKYCHALVI